MRGFFWSLAVVALAACPVAAQTREPLALRDFGSFHVGGRLAEVSGPVRKVPLGDGKTQEVDPNGTFLVEDMYVQYFLPQNRRGKFPMLMWHGGGLTGVTYETTPDGRPGWLDMFARKGWDVYVSDAVERGRAGFAPPEVFKGEPVFAPLGFAWEQYRIGAPGSFNNAPEKRVAYPGGQFPVAGYDNLVRQMVPRWLTTDDAILTATSPRSTAFVRVSFWFTASPAPSPIARRWRGPTRSRRSSISKAHCAATRRPRRR